MVEEDEKSEEEKEEEEDEVEKGEEEHLVGSRLMVGRLSKHSSFILLCWVDKQEYFISDTKMIYIVVLFRCLRCYNRMHFRWFDCCFIFLGCIKFMYCFILTSVSRALTSNAG